MIELSVSSVKGVATDARRGVTTDARGGVSISLSIINIINRHFGALESVAVLDVFSSTVGAVGASMLHVDEPVRKGFSKEVNEWNGKSFPKWR